LISIELIVNGYRETAEAKRRDVSNAHLHRCSMKLVRAGYVLPIEPTLQLHSGCAVKNTIYPTCKFQVTVKEAVKKRVVTT